MFLSFSLLNLCFLLKLCSVKLMLPQTLGWSLLLSTSLDQPGSWEKTPQITTCFPGGHVLGCPWTFGVLRDSRLDETHAVACDRVPNGSPHPNDKKPSLSLAFSNYLAQSCPIVPRQKCTPAVCKPRGLAWAAKTVRQLPPWSVAPVCPGSTRWFPWMQRRPSLLLKNG